MSRPLPDTLLNPLGREASLQKMRWTEDEWLEMADGSNVAKMTTEGMKDVVSSKKQTNDIHTEFDRDMCPMFFMTPYRNQEEKWVNTKERQGHLRIYGENSLFSQMNPAIMATRATSFHYEIATKVEFHPDHYSETAGLGLYYDSNNWIYLHVTYSEEEQQPVLTVLQAKLGKRIEYYNKKLLVPNGIIELKIVYELGVAKLYYRLDGGWMLFIDGIDVSYLSDEGVNGEPGEIGGFTGLFNFIGAVDAHQHDSYADFAYYSVTNKE